MTAIGGVVASMVLLTGLFGVCRPTPVPQPSGEVAYMCPPGTHLWAPGVPWGIYVCVSD